MKGLKGMWKSERRARWFFLAHLQGALGAGAGYVALLVLAYDRIGSAWAATAVLLADLAPAMLLGPLLGALADRTSGLGSEERLGALNGVYGATRDAGQVLGPAVAGGLLLLASPQLVLGLNAVT